MTERPRIYHRRVHLTGGPGQVVAELADDAHHFRVRLTHDGERVVELVGEAIRYPWTTCPGSAERLSDLHDMPLSPRSTAIGAHSRAREHCTHLFDLAGLAIAHATRGDGERHSQSHAQSHYQRRYECSVEGSPSGDERAQLACDGEPILDWRLHEREIQAPAPFAGVSLRGGGFIAWAESEFEPDMAEAALVLRRALFVSPVRFIDLDACERPSDLRREPGACFTFTEGTKQLALRVKNSQHDFTQTPERLLGELETKGEDRACSK